MSMETECKHPRYLGLHRVGDEQRAWCAVCRVGLSGRVGNFLRPVAVYEPLESEPVEPVVEPVVPEMQDGMLGTDVYFPLEFMAEYERVAQGLRDEEGDQEILAQVAAQILTSSEIYVQVRNDGWSVLIDGELGLRPGTRESALVMRLIESRRG